jgi:uncharacterized protein (TIGR02270 family)
MAVSPRAFLVEMYEEHLEEADFLYQYGLEARRQEDFTWPSLADFEARIEAHLDALVVGGALALRVCKRRALDGEPGELHAAMRVFCRQQRRSDVFDVLSDLDMQDVLRVHAIADALAWELSPVWERDIERLLVHGHPHLWPLFTKVIQFRQLPVGEILLRMLQKDATQDNANILITALGYVGDDCCIETLLPMLDYPELREQAALALIRLGSKDARRVVARQFSQGELWAMLPALLSSDSALSGVLRDYLRAGVRLPWICNAIAIQGDVGLVDDLISLLDCDTCGAAAAHALWLLTGTRLEEQKFIDMPLSEDELFDDERARMQSGDKILRADGQPYGEVAVQLTREPDIWRSWWHTKQDKFDTKLRYRLGVLFSPEILVQSLAAPWSSVLLRDWMAAELRTRYRCSLPINIEAPIATQRLQLHELASWAKPLRNATSPGAWVFQKG